MSDNSGNGGFVLYCVSGCYAEVHISWEIYIVVIDIKQILYFNSCQHIPKYQRLYNCSKMIRVASFTVSDVSLNIFLLPSEVTTAI